jgi:hypothetical protein
MKKLLSLILLALGVTLHGCAQSDKPPTPPAPKAPAPPPDTVKLEPKVIRDEAGPDNSHIKVKELGGGGLVEIRTWTAGPLAKVTRRERLDDKKKILQIVYRDGQKRRTDDPATVEHALDWTAEQLAKAGKSFGKIVGAEAVDEEEDKPAAAKPTETPARK